jgi:apolipoprotein N-acyltransferase
MKRPSRPEPARGLILLGAAASFLGFANPFVRLPLMVLVGPWALALLAAQAPSPRKAFTWGWLQGWLAASASLYWIALPVHDYGYLPWVLAVPCPMLMAAVLGLYPALFCLLLHLTRQAMRPLLWGLFAGLSWTALEALRGWLFSGFPWLTMAEALVPWPLAIQSLSVIGAYGLSGVLAACGTWLAGPGFKPRLATIFVLVALVGHGLWAMSRPIKTDGRFNAAMIQGNVDQSAKWDPESLAGVVKEYIALSRSVLATRPDVLIWPETALTFFVQEPSAETALVTDFASGLGVPLVAGAPGFERHGKDTTIFNRAYLIGAHGPAAFYDKEHLVPFGEYAPFGQDIPILSAMLEGVGAFTPGTHTAPLVSGRLAMGVLICYEAIFPELAQARVEAGANVLVNISNDAWFGRSAAPRQHLELAVLRAVEQGRFLLRATNTGITALVDPRGRITSESALFQEAAVAVSDVGLISEKTIYHRLHGLIEGLSALAALALLIWAVLTNKRTRGA